jgi:hypothetical protein
VQQADVAGDCKEKVVVERRQPGELIFEHLGCSLGALAFSLNLGLDLLWEDLIWKLS